MLSSSLGKAVYAGDTVLHFEDRAYFLNVQVIEVCGFDLTEEDVLDFARTERGVSGHVLSGNFMLGESL